MTGARRYWTDALCRRHWAWFDRVGPAEVALLSGPCARAAGLAAAIIGGGHVAGIPAAVRDVPAVRGPEYWRPGLTDTAGGGYPAFSPLLPAEGPLAVAGTYPAPVSQVAIPEPSSAWLVVAGAALAMWARRA